ncbi:MAG: DUF349 domain-containing protein [Actinomycetota bacterium]
MSPISNAHGRVDDENNVFVFEHGTERKVGQYPGVALEEALAYFERKFQELEANVRILEQRVKNKADASSIAKAAEKLQAELLEPAAVGNLEELRRRVSEITPNIEAMRQEKSEAIQLAISQTLQLRNEIADKAQTLADKDPKKTQWKQASVQMNELFDKWQASQKTGPKIPRKDADAIWKKFSQARNKFESNKRAFFAELTAGSKAAREKKSELVAKAEALVSKGASAAGDYRKLLDDWKTTGRSQGKGDDALWERFKSAGDAIYALRKEQIEKETVEFEANYQLKLQILKEAELLDPSKDLAEAKKALLAISTRFEKAGKVPKDKIRETEDRMKKVEKRIRDAEADQWRRSDPAAIERTNGVLSQLEESIAKLEADLEKAQAAKDTKKSSELEGALAARKSWLDAVKATTN